MEQHWNSYQRQIQTKKLQIGPDTYTYKVGRLQNLCDTYVDEIPWGQKFKREYLATISLKAI